MVTIGPCTIDIDSTIVWRITITTSAINTTSTTITTATTGYEYRTVENVHARCGTKSVFAYNMHTNKILVRL